MTLETRALATLHTEMKNPAARSWENPVVIWPRGILIDMLGSQNVLLVASCEGLLNQAVTYGHFVPPSASTVTVDCTLARPRSSSQSRRRYRGLGSQLTDRTSTSRVPSFTWTPCFWRRVAPSHLTKRCPRGRPVCYSCLHEPQFPSRFLDVEIPHFRGSSARYGSFTGR